MFEDGQKGFDIVLANPPYVRADAQFKHLLKDEPARQTAIAAWKLFRDTLKRSGIYKTLHEKWDLYIPFLERAHQLLNNGGSMIFIIPDAVNANKYATKSRELFLTESKVVRIDFCSEVDLFDAGVTNTILHFCKGKPPADHVPVRARRFAPDRNLFDKFVELLPSMPQAEFGETLFKQSGEKNEAAGANTVPLGNICYISYGLRACGYDTRTKKNFTTDDCIADSQDEEHPKRFVQGGDLSRWIPRRVRFMEWNTYRAPVAFATATFKQLHEVDEKIIAMRTPGDTPRVIYDQNELHFDTSSVGLVLWHKLKDVINLSISKNAKYKRQFKSSDVKPTIFRDELETLSLPFDTKYLIGVMNSEVSKQWLMRQRRHKLHLYPDDWKDLPIPAASAEQQAEIAALVQVCLDRKGQNVADIEADINARVAALYGL